MLYHYIESEPLERPRRLAEWNRVHTAAMTARKWSAGQQEAMDRIRAGLRVADANAMLGASRWLYLSGEPGAGKSEVIVHAAVEAATAGYHVLILCPTGTLVHSYKDRLPEVDNIVVETLHSGFAALYWSLLNAYLGCGPFPRQGLLNYFGAIPQKHFF